jgi:hypothetical protein
MPEFTGHPNRHHGKPPDALIKRFRTLLDNTHEAMHRMAIYSCIWECMKYNSRNMTYNSDEQQHAMELCIYHAIKIEAQGLDGERISQMCRGTGCHSWCRGD